MTSELIVRVAKHKQDTYDGFTKKYNVKRLVWYEVHENAESAIRREKQIKEWKRDWKRNLIKHDNPHWNDLYDAICK
jgi:putative endonuclease